MMFTLNPLTLKKWRRFQSIRRGYFSFLFFMGMVMVSCVFELFINSRALVVKYEGKYFFPTYGAVIPGKTFGLDYDYETNYRQLKKKFTEASSENFVLLPIVPYNAFETELEDGATPPLPPSFESRHFLGTDIVGRDILARLAYGFRIAIFFSLILLLAEYLIGVTLGLTMGYVGGHFDLLFQRLIEIWSNLPFLYVIMIISSLLIPTFGILVGVMVFFSWINMTWYMRTAAYKEKARDYVAAARVIGSSHGRIITQHIMPNVVSLMVTFMPFTISGAIVSLTSLDYLGFGLPAPTPSWGELLAQGTSNLQAIWIVASVTIAMVIVLTMVTFIGEAVRESFDPKRYSTYE